MSTYKPGRPNKYNPTTGVGQKPPSKPGEYRIRDAGGAISYIGETNNLGSGLISCQKGKKFLLSA